MNEAKKRFTWRTNKQSFHARRYGSYNISYTTRVRFTWISREYVASQFNSRKIHIEIYIDCAYNEWAEGWGGWVWVEHRVTWCDDQNHEFWHLAMSQRTWADRQQSECGWGGTRAHDFCDEWSHAVLTQHDINRTIIRNDIGRRYLIFLLLFFAFALARKR